MNLEVRILRTGQLVQENGAETALASNDANAYRASFSDSQSTIDAAAAENMTTAR